MKLFHHYHHNKLHSRIHSDFWNFELSVWLQTIGYSLVSLFIPIFMLTAGYSITLVMVYCAVFYLLDVPLNFLARILIVRFGARFVMIAGIAFAVMYFAAFPYLAGGRFALLILLAILAALYDALYWVAHYYLFLESIAEDGAVGRSNGILNSIRSFAGMLGPALGAGILLFAREKALLLASIGFMILSVFPLFLLRHIKNKPRLGRISYRKFFGELPEKRNFFSWFLYSIHWGANDIIWPIFIFVLFGTLESIALVAIIISVSKIVLSYTSGIATGKNRERLTMLGIVALILIWILRFIYASTFFYYLSILLIGFFAVFVEVPLDTNLLERARQRKESLDASTFRNAVIMLPQGIMFLALIFLVGVFKISFISAIASLTLLLLVNQAIFISKGIKKGA